MTTAATSLLGLALPVTGELSGTWGDTVNNSITSLLDTAVAGTTTLTERTLRQIMALGYEIEFTTEPVNIEEIKL